MRIPFRRYWDLLAKYIQPQKNRFILLMILLLTSIVLQVVNPQIMRFFIDATQTTKEYRDLAIAAIVFITIAMIQQIVSVGATYVGENVAWIATNSLRAELARHCLFLDMSYHNNMSPGELIERIDGDVAELSAGGAWDRIISIHHIQHAATVDVYCLFLHDHIHPDERRVHPGGQHATLGPEGQYDKPGGMYQRLHGRCGAQTSQGPGLRRDGQKLGLNPPAEDGVP